MTLSSEISGGAGFTFEDAPVAIYLGALLGEESAPGLEDRIVVRVAVQQAAFGEPLDDLIVDGRGRDDSIARLSLQTKRELTISAATTNNDFREVVTRAWSTLQKPEFRENADRVGTVTGTISDAARRAFVTVCEWARASNTVESFAERFQAGAADDDKRAAFKAVRDILGDDADLAAEAKAFRLLRHFVLIKVDVLHEGATDEVHAIERLRSHLQEPDQAGDVWQRLLRVARSGAGRSHEYSRLSLLSQFHGAVRLAGARSLRPDLERIAQECRNALESIPCEIDGVGIDRPQAIDAVNSALQSRRFVNIVGLPGTGKSAILRACVLRALQDGATLFLKSDRLAGPSWAAHAHAWGITCPAIDALLCEIAATGSAVLFLDGIDRVEVAHRGVIADLLNAILRSPLLANLKVVMTCRDSGIEPLRSWLPPAIFRGAGVSTVEVKQFTDSEAEQLAEAKPLLRPLLFGDERVQEIARRPFFAAILAQSLHGTGTDERRAPQSEVELIEGWWARGGYNSDEQTLYQRQRALVQLAKAGAMDLGRRIPLHGVDLEALTELRRDNIIKDVRTGHTVQFAHDIFFEWAFLHLLIDRDAAWLEEIRAVGEPPALGRVIELLSQATFSQAEEWRHKLGALETSNLRPQWTRGWLLAPFGAPTFLDHADSYTAVILENKDQRLSKLAVWFQAEKTRANPLVLNRTYAAGDMTRRDIVRFADALAWPSEPASWARFCSWAIRNISEFPTETIPDLLAAFEVWQNMLADVPNAVSREIFHTVLAWLQDIEGRQYPAQFSYNPGRWSDLPRGGLEELEQRLRNIVLRAARVEPENVRTYLVRVRDWQRLRGHAFDQIMTYAPTLVTNQSVELAAITQLQIKDYLPNDEEARERRRGMYSRQIDYHDWHRLAFHEDYRAFYPPSPLREPFASLFRAKPDEALALVRDITNHAITAWRQLHSLDRQNGGTPIPLVFEFPWGRQEFWGDGRVYLWPRGQWAPNPVICGLMALENWAFDQIDHGRDVDEVIRDVLAGHESCAVLSIAVALALSTNAVSAATLPLATSQKLWEWDIARSVHESGEEGLASNLMGFSKAADRAHAQAVRASNARPARRLEIRSLAQLFVLGANEELRRSAQEAIAAFPDNLAFDLEEDQNLPAHVAKKRRTAEIWAEFSRPENYRATPAPDGSGTLVYLENPHQSAPDVVAITENNVRLGERLTLLQWATETLKSGSISSHFTIEEAINRARAIDNADLFAEPHGQIIDTDWDRNAASAVAAAVARYGGEVDGNTLQWCRDVIFRAAATVIFVDDVFVSRAMHLYHPCDFAIRGLDGLILRDSNDKASKEALLRLGGNLLEEVSLKAITVALSMWERDAALAWTALRLGTQVSLASRVAMPSAFGRDHSTERTNINNAVEAAISEFGAGAPPLALPNVPEAWAHAPRPRRGDGFDDDEPVWREPDEFIRWDFLPKVLSGIPIAVAIPDVERGPLLLAYIYQLLRWTIAKIEPSWMDERECREHRGTELIQWRQSFGEVLGKIALELNEADAQANILEPIFALGDDPAASLINPIVDTLSAMGIMDAPQIMPRAIHHMEACVARVLRDDEWRSAQYNNGTIYGNDLPDIVGVCLFATGIQAGGAARFANGDWRDVKAILPVVDPFVRAVGEIPFVLGSFLSLCESSAEHYPAETFVDQIEFVLNKQAGTPIGWYGTLLPSRIAALVHTFAERSQPLPQRLAQRMLRILDRLVDMGDRRSAALQTSETFKDIRQSAGD